MLVSTPVVSILRTLLLVVLLAASPMIDSYLSITAASSCKVVQLLSMYLHFISTVYYSLGADVDLDSYKRCELGLEEMLLKRTLYLLYSIQHNFRNVNNILPNIPVQNTAQVSNLATKNCSGGRKSEVVGIFHSHCQDVCDNPH